MRKRPMRKFSHESKIHSEIKHELEKRVVGAAEAMGYTDANVVRVGQPNTGAGFYPAWRVRWSEKTGNTNFNVHIWISATESASGISDYINAPIRFTIKDGEIRSLGKIMNPDSAGAYPPVLSTSEVEFDIDGASIQKRIDASARAFARKWHENMQLEIKAQAARSAS